MLLCIEKLRIQKAINNKKLIDPKIITQTHERIERLKQRSMEKQQRRTMTGKKSLVVPVQEEKENIEELEDQSMESGEEQELKPPAQAKPPPP